MKTSELNCDLVNQDISKLIERARKSSARWTDVLEYDGPVNEKPVLANGARLAVFCVEYTVNRTIWKGKHDILPPQAFKLWWLAARGTLSSSTSPVLIDVDQLQPCSLHSMLDDGRPGREEIAAEFVVQFSFGTQAGTVNGKSARRVESPCGVLVVMRREQP
jgi:hypothetical protein